MLWKNPSTPAGLEPANFGSSGGYDNHGSTRVNASPTLDHLYPQFSFYRLSRPQDQSGHGGVKKNLHPSYTRDRTRAIQSVAKRLAAWDTWPIMESSHFLKSSLVWSSQQMDASLSRPHRSMWQKILQPTKWPNLQSNPYLLNNSMIYWHWEVQHKL